MTDDQLTPEVGEYGRRLMSNFPCIDCGMKTVPGEIIPDGNGGYSQTFEVGTIEHYSVKNSVWRKTGLKETAGSLCVGCIEKRLGRQLEPKDFKYGVEGYKEPNILTPRLLSRLLGMKS